MEKSELPSLVKGGSLEAAGGSFKKINLLISTTPALRATPPHLRRGVLPSPPDTPLDPSSPYSASKASADVWVLSYFKTYGLPALITRCSNNYGPYQFPEN